jgi:hypothetical protein
VDATNPTHEDRTGRVWYLQTAPSSDRAQRIVGARETRDIPRGTVHRARNASRDADHRRDPWPSRGDNGVGAPDAPAHPPAR